MQGQVGVIVKVGFGLIMLMMAIRANASSEAYVLHAYAAGVAVVAVQIDLKSPGTRVTGAMAKGGSGHAENWFGMIKRAQPMAAITGTYFDVGSRMPVGDIQIDGVLRHFGGLGSALRIRRKSCEIYRCSERSSHGLEQVRFCDSMRSAPGDGRRAGSSG